MAVVLPPLIKGVWLRYNCRVPCAYKEGGVDPPTLRLSIELIPGYSNLDVQTPTAGSLRQLFSASRNSLRVTFSGVGVGVGDAAGDAVAVAVGVDVSIGVQSIQHRTAHAQFAMACTVPPCFAVRDGPAVRDVPDGQQCLPLGTSADMAVVRAAAIRNASDKTAEMPLDKTRSRDRLPGKQIPVVELRGGFSAHGRAVQRLGN
eukprot:71848-Chlamydomonas_euryale.AAC.2